MKKIKLICGDSLKLIKDVKAGSIDLIVCDGPYGVTTNEWDKVGSIQEYNLQLIKLFARVLKPGGVVRFATDWANYADWALERFTANPDLDWTAERPADWTVPPADHVTTRYETKGLGDCKPVFFDFIRRC